MKVMHRTPGLPVFMLLALTILFAAPGNAQDGSDDSALRYEKADTSFAWKNLATFETGEEYLRALDLDFVSGLDTDNEYRQLVHMVWILTQRYSPSHLRDLVAFTNATENQELKDLYAGILLEVLENEDRYADIAQAFPSSGKVDIARNFARVSDPHDVQDSTEDARLERTQTNLFGHVKVEVRVGRTTLFAMFDTGADHTVVSRSFAKANGVRMLSDETTTLGTPNGLNVTAGFGEIPEMRLGSVVVRNIPVLVFPDTSMRFGMAPDIDENDIILGWPLISKLRFEINLPESTYQALVSADSRDPARGNLFWFGYPGLKMATENGQSLLFGFDAGADGSNLKPGIFKKLDLPIARQDTIGYMTAGGLDTMYVDVMGEFSFLLDGYRITKPDVEVHKDADFYFLLQDGLIGADIFQGNTVIIDYPNRLFRIVRRD